MQRYFDREDTHAHLPLIARGLAIEVMTNRTGQGAQWAAANNLPAGVQRVLQKAAVPAAVSSNSQWAGALLGSEGNAAAVAFAGTLKTRSVLYRIRADNGWASVPMKRQSIAAVTSSMTAAMVGEGKPKPLTRLTVAGEQMTPVKAASMMIVTEDFVRDISSEAQALFSRELQTAVASEVDAILFGLLVHTGTPTHAATSDVWADLKTMLDSLAVTSDARIYFVAAVDVAKRLATKKTTDGAAAFPTVGVQGGELLQAPLLVSDQLPAGELVLINAAGVAVGADEISIRASREANIEASDAPGQSAATGTGAQMVSLWQVDSVALLAEVSLVVSTLRAGSVVTCTGIAW